MMMFLGGMAAATVVLVLGLGSLIFWNNRRVKKEIPEGMEDVTLAHKLIFSAYKRLIEQVGAVNFLVFPFTSPDLSPDGTLERFIITVKRGDGLTPEEKLHLMQQALERSVEDCTYLINRFRLLRPADFHDGQLFQILKERANVCHALLYSKVGEDLDLPFPEADNQSTEEAAL